MKSRSGLSGERRVLVIKVRRRMESAYAAAVEAFQMAEDCRNVANGGKEDSTSTMPETDETDDEPERSMITFSKVLNRPQLVLFTAMVTEADTSRRWRPGNKAWRQERHTRR